MEVDVADVDTLEGNKVACQAQLRDSRALRTFPHRLHAHLKADLRDKIRSGQVRGGVECMDWLEDGDSVEAANQKVDDLWNIPLDLERGELRWQHGAITYESTDRN